MATECHKSLRDNYLKPNLDSVAPPWAIDPWLAQQLRPIEDDDQRRCGLEREKTMFSGFNTSKRRSSNGRQTAILAKTCLILALVSFFTASVGAEEKRELLAQHETIALLKSLEYRLCSGLTSACPEYCGDSGEFAEFEIVTYTRFVQLSEYAEKQETFYVQMSDYNKNPLPHSFAAVIKDLNVGTYVHLWWDHEYVTSGGGSTVVRTVRKLEKLNSDSQPRVKAPAETVPGIAGTQIALKPATLYVSAKAAPKLVLAGGQANIEVTVHDQFGQAVPGATVALSVGGGTFARSGTSTVSGATQPNGVFAATWRTLDASVYTGDLTYVIPVSVSAPGFPSVTSEVRLTVTKGGTRSPGLPSEGVPVIPDNRASGTRSPGLRSPGVPVTPGN